MSHSSLSLLGQHSLFYNESKPLCVTFKVLLGRLLPASPSVPPLYPAFWLNQTNYGFLNVLCSQLLMSLLFITLAFSEIRANEMLAIALTWT